MNLASTAGRRFLPIKLWALAIVAGASLHAAAQDFPAKPVELPVLFPAGPSADSSSLTITPTTPASHRN